MKTLRWRAPGLAVAAALAVAATLGGVSQAGSGPYEPTTTTTGGVLIYGLPPSFSYAPYVKGIWDTVAVTADGTRYPQKWDITEQLLVVPAGGVSTFSGTDDGYKLTGSVKKDGELTNVSTAGSYESEGTAKLSRDHTLTGSFKDSNGITGTFTATLVRPGPNRPPSTGTVTVTEGPALTKAYVPDEIYVKSGTIVRFCNISPLEEQPYIPGIKPWPDGTHNGKPNQDAGEWILRRGDCESLRPTVSTPQVYVVGDGIHPAATAYLIVTP